MDEPLDDTYFGENLNDPNTRRDYNTSTNIPDDSNTSNNIYLGQDKSTGLLTNYLKSNNYNNNNKFAAYISSKIAKRKLISILIFTGFTITFGMRCTLPIATGARRKYSEAEIQQMLDAENDSENRAQAGSNDIDLTSGNLSLTEPKKVKFDRLGEKIFNWTSVEIGMVNSAFFYGYGATQVPAGMIASMYPTNRLFGATILMTAFINLFIPMVISTSQVTCCILKISQGLVEGMLYPCCHGIMALWAPPLERSKLATMALAGSYAGAVVGPVLSGLLTEYINWYSSFYLFSVLGILWFLAWDALVFETPLKDPYIDKDEAEYITAAIGNASHKNKLTSLSLIPWKSFFTSLPVWSIIVANFCRSWTFYLFTIHTAGYFEDLYGVQVAKAAVFAALPHLVMAILVPIGGQMADNLRGRHIMTTTNVRKLFNCGGFGMEAFFLLIMSWTTGQDKTLLALTAAVGFSGFAISGFNVNHLDIAPRYASILMGLSNSAGTISGMVGPYIVGQITSDVNENTSFSEKSYAWKEVFIIAALLHICGIIFYGIFASGEEQSWAKLEDDNLRLFDVEGEEEYQDLEGENAVSGRNANYGAL